MPYREELYDNVHETIVDNLREEYELWGIIKNTNADTSDKKDICREKMSQLQRRANKIRA